VPAYDYACPVHGRVEVRKPADEARAPEYCADCVLDGLLAERPMRRIYTPQRIIIRPSGHALKPGERTSTPGLAFDDFRYELERGELREDPTPLTFTPAELARMDEMPLALAPDPERDHRFAQLIHQHWTEDLSDDTVRRRALEAQHHATAHGQPAAG
jgi:hypothetical protein